MRLYRAEILHNGLRTNTVIKENLSAAEVIVLRHIHGADAVVDIEHIGDSQMPYHKLYEDLCQRYTVKKVTECFPGASPVLPDKLSDVGIKKEGIQPVIARGKHNPDFKTKAEKDLDEGSIDGADDEDEGDEDKTPVVTKGKKNNQDKLAALGG